VKRKSTQSVRLTRGGSPPGAAILLLLVPLLLAACSASSSPSSPSTSHDATLAGNNGQITYSTSPADLLIRTFYGGGNLGTLNYSPVISIYGDGTFVLGPGLQMRQGRLTAHALQQLLQTLVNDDALLKLSQREFYDVPDQNATILQLILDHRQYAYIYGPFGALQENSSALREYHRLARALTSIATAIKGPTSAYSSRAMALLVHQDYSPDLTQPLLDWNLQAFSLFQIATYECGAVPQDLTGPNIDTGCLTFTAPHKAYLPGEQELQSIKDLLKGAQQGEFSENNLYYRVALRPLLPDELAQGLVAMLGSQELTYAGVKLYRGSVPHYPPTPSA
jgi:hypothetical protein